MSIIVKSSSCSFLISHGDESEASILSGLSVLRKPYTYDLTTITEELLEIFLSDTIRQVRNKDGIFLDQTQSVLQSVKIDVVYII